MSRSLFEKRINPKPFLYPELLEFKDAIRHSYWLHTEFNFTSDIQNYHVDVSEYEKNTITKAMLAISQIEVSVKTFWTRLYDYLPAYEISDVGVTFGESECFIEGTEVLTPEGWKDFRDLKVGDLVLQYNNDYTSEFVPNTAVIKKEHKGIMYRFNKKAWESIVTPNHRIIYFNKYGTMLETTAENYKLASDKFLPFAADKKGGKTALTFMERLAIAIQADGSLRHWRNKDGEVLLRGASEDVYTYDIRIRKSRKKERLLWILENLSCSVKYAIYDIPSNPGMLNFEVKVPIKVNFKEFDWVDLTESSREWARDFVEELAEWDGHRMPYKVDCKIRYTTTNKRAADMVQAIGTMAGYYCTLNTYEDPRSEKFNDVYTISFIENRKRVAVSNPKGKEEIWYEGNVYCTTVPSGMIFTRYNNCVAISGNCRHFDAYSFLLEKLGMNELFERIREFPALMKRVEYMEDFMKRKNEDRKGMILSLVLFSLFIEHISLFSQFYIMMSYNKFKNLFKGISNAIEATSKEEEIHGRFGIQLFQILHVEHNELFTPDFYEDLKVLASKAFDAEMGIIDWIYEGGDLDFARKDVVKAFVANRYNKSLDTLGVDLDFPVDPELLKETTWFDVEVLSTKETDFFNKRSTDYSKKQKQITADDLF